MHEINLEVSANNKYSEDVFCQPLAQLGLLYILKIGLSQRIQTINTFVGPSGVRALPLGVAVEQSVHYFWDYFSSSFFFSVPHTVLQEGVVLGGL